MPWDHISPIHGHPMEADVDCTGQQFGAKFIVRGGQFEAPEGTPRARNVVLEFADYATAVACYHSPEYQAAKAFRDGASVADLIIIEGYDGVQP